MVAGTMKRKKVEREKEKGGVDRGRLQRGGQTARRFLWEHSALAASSLSVVVPLIQVAASEDTRPYKTPHLQTIRSLLLQAGLSSSTDSTLHLTVFTPY